MVVGLFLRNAKEKKRQQQQKSAFKNNLLRKRLQENKKKKTKYEQQFIIINEMVIQTKWIPFKINVNNGHTQQEQHNKHKQ